MEIAETEEKILVIDVGGSRIKGTVLDMDGKMITDYQKVETPSPANPQNILTAIEQLAKGFEPFDKVSVGFPGYVRDGIVHTAPNLGTEAWKGIDLNKSLGNILKKPVRVVNDADLQGLGIASGQGLEMMVTLGTGFGTALLLNGVLLPHLEIAHHPVVHDKTYDEYIGDVAYDEIGQEKWNERLKKVINILKVVFNYDHLYLGGGNSKKITFKIDDNMTLVSNIDGIKGGAKLWQMSKVESSMPQ